MPRATPELETLIAAVRKKKATYEDPSRTEFEAFRSWTRQLAELTSETTGAPPPSLSGFTIAEIALSGSPGGPRSRGAGNERHAPREPATRDGRLWVIHEDPGTERGAGIVVLRTGDARQALIQAPHTFFDRHTLQIALSAFDALNARALLINTVHRAGRPGAKVSEDAPSKEDVAHNPSSFFMAAHEALATALDGPVVLQMHGFGDAQAPGVQAIVSAAKTSARLDGLLASLREILPPEAVLHYPSQIRVLGGTTNAQARWSVRHGTPFVHIELSYSLRSRLEADDAFRWRFVQGLKPALSQGPP